MTEVVHRFSATSFFVLRRRHSSGMNSTLAYLGTINTGVFSRAQAIDCGESDRTLAEALKAGLIVRLRRGMYAPAELYNSGTDAAKHLLHARAALAAQRGNVVLTGASAAALHGFDLYQQDLSMVHLLRLDGGASRHSAQANHHIDTQEIEQHIVVREGVPSIAPARAVWEVACRSTMQGGVVTADSALRLQPGLFEEIRELSVRFAHFPGSRQGRITIDFADGKSESAGESVTRVEFHRHRIPKPTLQFTVVDRHGRPAGTADFHWDDHRHLGEFDGKVKYQKFLRPGESPADCVFREKGREDLMRADLRGMTRFVWSTVMPQTVRRTMDDLRRALEQSHRLYVRGRVIIA